MATVITVDPSPLLCISSPRLSGDVRYYVDDDNGENYDDYNSDDYDVFN